ncbi:conserved hypothetical protein [Alteromonas sp. 38]|uniref:UDP-2,4-diacetamido-2,4, 6-trideoxy-beta-L-altropyranose hydrolase n=1 Tax=unclassified Alteromonas TaxID=2614992 RepID=UPI0012F08763|nr:MULTISPECIES: UDP-2,4-diacetamido-2,4,6-trideoxy-beta-L-altropyranose hydrolase [unclassified Alteromonas]CAD5285934.1 conserved hypothetical protein [Alteromonas sp. 154]VXB35566.1 conserved hypothetical protein [Alteromonas sp. 38]
MHIAFRVEGNSQIGLGHLMRCLALSQFAHAQKIRVSFLMSDISSSLAQSRSDWVGDIFPIQSNSKELDTIATFCRDEHVDCLLIDGYQFDTSYRYQLSQFLKSENKIFAIIDDNNDSGMLYADCIINQNSHAEQLEYSVTEPQAYCCLGENYRILRSEFLLQPYQLNLASSLSNREALTIILGGADTANISLQLAVKFSETLDNAPINIITGSAFQYVKDVDQFSVNNPRIRHWHNAQLVSNLFLNSRMVISAAGSTQYELQATYTPALLLVVAQNQQQASLQSQRQGRAQIFDVREEFDIDEFVRQACKVWHNDEKLMDMIKANMSQATINGADNIISTLTKLVTSLEK